MYFEEIIENNNCYKYILKDSNSNSLSYSSFLTLLSFNSFILTNILKKFHSSFYFECIPINKENLNNIIFEFMIIKAPELDYLQLDQNSFQNKFILNEKVISFNNLGGDASLIVPCPNKNESNEYMRNIHTFITHASDDLIELLWKKVAEVMIQRLEDNIDQPIWLSTCGNGVYWLHVRLDSYPKYYSWVPYKKWPIQSISSLTTLTEQICEEKN